MDACDTFIPEPVRELDKPFLMPVEDVFTITGRGTVVTGRIERGIVKVGDEVEIVGLGDTQQDGRARASRCSASCSTRARPATTSACCSAARSARRSSAAWCSASRARSRRTTKFTGEVYVLKKEEGGRHTPFFNGYRPQFYFRTTDVTGTVTLPAGTEMVMPGDNIKVDVELISPIACEEELRFAIREGGKTVGAGVVTKILAETPSRSEQCRDGSSRAPSCARARSSYAIARQSRERRLELQSRAAAERVSMPEDRVYRFCGCYLRGSDRSWGTTSASVCTAEEYLQRTAAKLSKFLGE